MTPATILCSLSPETITRVFSWLQKEQKPVFRTCLTTLVARRKLRPVFVERKPPQERYVWMQKELARPEHAQIATNVLHLWISGDRQQMLISFLDALGIKHDGEGGIEGLPVEPESEAVKAAVEQLLAKYPHEEVAAYLRTFQIMEEKGWASLDAMFAEDPRLALYQAAS